MASDLFPHQKSSAIFKHNLLTLGELLSNDRRAVGFGSNQLRLRDASIGGGGVWVIKRRGKRESKVGKAGEGDPNRQGAGERGLRGVTGGGVKLSRLRTALHIIERLLKAVSVNPVFRY